MTFFVDVDANGIAQTQINEGKTCVAYIKRNPEIQIQLFKFYLFRENKCAIDMQRDPAEAISAARRYYIRICAQLYRYMYLCFEMHVWVVRVKQKIN